MLLRATWPFSVMPTFNHFTMPGSSVSLGKVYDDLVEHVVGDREAFGRALADTFDALELADHEERYSVHPGDRLAALDKLLRDAWHLYRNMARADDDTRHEIFRSYPNIRLPHEPDEPVDGRALFERDRSHIRRCVRALARARAEVKQEIRDRRSSGRPANDDLAIACLHFAELYVKCSKKPFTIAPKVSGYTPGIHDAYPVGVFSSPGAKFVTRCVLELFPDTGAVPIFNAMTKARARINKTKSTGA